MLNSLRLFVLTLIVAFPSFCFAKEKENATSLIPQKTEFAIVAWKQVAKSIGLDESIFSQISLANVQIFDDQAHPIYTLRLDKSYSFQFDSCNGTTRFLRSEPAKHMTKTEALAAQKIWLSEEEVKTRLEKLKATLLPDAKLQNFDLMSGVGSFSSVEGGKKTVRYQGLDESTAVYAVEENSVLTPKRAVITLERGRGEIRMLILFNHMYTQQDSTNSGGTSPSETLTNKTNQRIIEFQDKWLLSKNLLMEEKDGSSAFFQTETRQIFNPNNKVVLSSDECTVLMNGEPLTLQGDLLVRPKVSLENPLIFADYFPKFLIDTKREGDTITLHGQLPDKGKTAILTLGSKEATVDGKPFTLSGAPQEIDGRLYLPYELLHECNGVLVRWDAKKNTLWVDTRYLRRP